MSMAAPYGGGRFLSLFRKKIDTLTVQYRDVNDGLHGAIFTTARGRRQCHQDTACLRRCPCHTCGRTDRSRLLQQGANAPQSPEHLSAKIKASAIQVEMIRSDEIKLPAQFQIALYENLVHQLEKQGTFQHVYRDSDRTAANVATWLFSIARSGASRPAARGPAR